MRLIQLREFCDSEDSNAWLRQMARRGVDVTIHDVRCLPAAPEEGGGYENFLLVCSAELEMDSDDMKAFVEPEDSDDDEELLEGSEDTRDGTKDD